MSYKLVPVKVDEVNWTVKDVYKKALIESEESEDELVQVSMDGSKSLDYHRQNFNRVIAARSSKIKVLVRQGNLYLRKEGISER